MRTIISSLVFWACLAGLATPVPTAASPRLQVGVFRVDATPPLGEPLIWDTLLKQVDDPLWAKGIVLQSGRQRFVLCTLDWCELCNESYADFCAVLAKAAGTAPGRVLVHCVHQHTAPYADRSAHRLLDQAPLPPPHLSQAFLDTLSARLAAAVREACGRLQPFDSVGLGEAKVERVASHRRLPDGKGGITVRFSTGGKDPQLAAAPEGRIDPLLKTVTLARGATPLVRLHYYATHPQTMACNGRAAGDFAGQAREAMEQKEKVFQLYFTGCAGDQTVGKYNDGSDAARNALGQRLLAGLVASAQNTRYAPANAMSWHSAPVTLAPRTEPAWTLPSCQARINDTNAAPGVRIYDGAIRQAYLERLKKPLRITWLQIGGASILHLPGEPMLEFQEFAQSLRPGGLVAVAGYHDTGPGYICTDVAFKEGGYEPSASNSGPGSEDILKKAIRQIAAKARPAR